MIYEQLLKRFPFAACLVLAVLAVACGGRMRPVPEQAAGQDTVPQPRHICIVLGGDVMQHMPQIHAARRDSTYDYSATFRHLRQFLDTADITIFNLETTLSTGRYSGYPLFAAPVQLASALRDCGVDAVTLANNHMLDRGRAGVLSTLQALDSAGVRHTGVFADSAGYRTANPLIFNVRGIRLALLNYTYGTNGMPVREGTIVNLIDTVRIAADILRTAEHSPDVTAVYFHWGYEYHREPNAEQRRLAEWCHARGVDIVAGGHPHVLQPIEYHRDSIGEMRGITAYSLGNLVSNQRRRYRDGGILLRLDITIDDSRQPTFEVSYLPVWVHTPAVDGRREYMILPAPVADTMLAGTPEKAVYDIFSADVRELLRDSLIIEIK